jgi:ribose 5-phosphate isomerase A
VIDEPPSVPAPLPPDSVIEAQKRAAAGAGAALAQDGMCVGLGTGSTVAYLLVELANRGLRDMRYASSSPATTHAATALGLSVHDLDDFGDALDLAIDGADQIDPDAWLIKGGGAAHTREKILASAARRFVVIASAAKAVEALRPPVPVEILRFGSRWTLQALAPAELRNCPPSPDGNLLGDYLGAIEDPAALSARLSSTTGLVEHGLFSPELVSDILIAGPQGISHRRGAKAPL